MTQTLSGFPLQEELFRSERTLVYRSAQPDTGRPVILKVIRDPRPPREEVLWLKREYELLGHLRAVEGVIEALEIGSDRDQWFVVLEDMGGRSLASIADSRPMRTSEFLTVAVRVAATLARVHAADVIHRDINPANILFNRGTGQVRLIDFGIATRLSRESVRFESATAMEGTLAYISPEQTGRMNRSVDHRTDLYSLGATFHHLLTGRPPFETVDPVGLVHAHMARVPTPITELSPQVPAILSAIVEKLLAKAPEDRYQSAEGLRVDLEDCLRQERETGVIEPFPLDRSHTPTRLVLTDKLYGRGPETQKLLEVFERVAGGRTEFVLVAGYSGVGKSSLVQELYRPITARNGFFVSGKFDQFQRDIPYAVVIQALRDLTRQILTESEVRLSRWKAQLLEALGPNAQVLCEVIPELELVLGPQAPAVELSSAEARNRLQLVFTRFLQVFARAEHPLTVFLDDLQWVDRGSLRLLESLLADGEVKHLLVIGAYRDNEVAPGHPLLLCLDRLAHANIGTETVRLAPLEEAHVVELLADVTAREPSDVGPLAGLIFEKTGGNPFFVREFLKELYAEDLVRLDSGRWTWDREAIRERGITDNVVEMISARLRHLSADTQRILQVAGTLGNRFDLETLAVADAQSVSATWKSLWPAVEGGYLIVLSDAYKLLGVELEGDDEGVAVPLRFAHDRVQQAAHALVDDEAVRRGSWQIGQRIAARWPVDVSPERLFDIVGHLNAGRSAAGSQAERDRLAELNLMAARRARTGAAFSAAYAHAKLGVELLGADGDTRRYDLAMPLLTECVETAYQTADYAGMDRWFARALASAKDVLDTAWIHQIKTEAFNAQGRPLDALAHALDYLDALGVTCPRDPSFDDVVAEMGAAAELMAGRTMDDLERAPDMSDPAVRIAVGLICKIYSSAYVASPLVFAVITLRQFQLVVRHGNCAVSGLSYAVYGLLMAGLANDVKSAYAFGSLSSRMLDRPDARRFEAQALHLFNCHTRMWHEHLRECADGERRAYQVGLETGEMEFGSYGGHVASKYAFLHGHELEPLGAEMAQYTTAMRRYRQEIACNSHLPWHQAVLNLTKFTREPHRLRGDILDARAARPALDAVNDRMAISNTLTAELILCVIFERFPEAVAAGGEGNGFLDAVLSQFNQPAHMFFDALARLNQWHHVPVSEQPALREAAEAALATLTGWAESAPVNLAQKVALLEAELLSIDGRTMEARERFDEAIELCRRHEFVLDEAIASEAAARAYLRQGRTVAARHYLQDAHDCYAKWGASSKVSAMEAEHVTLRPAGTIGGAPVITRGSVARTLQPTSSTRRGEALDLAALLRAAEAISSEVVLSKLLRRLLTTLMESAGAARAVLVLLEDGVARVEAEGTADGEVQVLMGTPLLGEGGRSTLVPETFYNYAVRSGVAVVVDDASHNQRHAMDPYVVERGTRSALCVPIKNQGRTKGCVYLENDQVAGAFTPARTELVTLLAGQIAVSIDNARLYANLEERVAQRTEQLEARNVFIREVFGRYMSDDVVDTLLESRSALRLGGERRIATLMFTDLRGFTAMCERLTPERTVRTLNNYLSVMTGIVQRHGGTINNIMGDALLVVFGAPLWRDDHVDRAVVCAIEMQLAMAEVNQNNAAEGLPGLTMGIGIHTGEVVVGNIGSEKRAKYSVIGSHANIASRVETTAAGGEVYISEATRGASTLGLRVAGERMIHPKGIEQPLAVFRVMGIEGRDDLRLPDAAGEREALPAARAVTVRKVNGKEVSKQTIEAELLATGPRSVELRLPVALPAGTDLVMESPGGLVYVKVATAGETSVAIVTGGDVTGL
ncbi:MAG: AAA family ATPase [Myxococcota bacterium]